MIAPAYGGFELRPRQLLLEIIAVRLWQPAPIPRHLLHTFSRLGHNDRRCAWYYSNYGRSSTASAYEVSASTGAGDGRGGGGGDGGDGTGGEEEIVLAERRPEWDHVYMQAIRGSIRNGFQSVSSSLPPLCVVVYRTL